MRARINTATAQDTVVGTCEWIWGRRPLAEVLAGLAAAGCGGIEVSGEPDRSDREHLAHVLAAHGIAATGITAICPWPTEDRDLALPQPDGGRRAVSYYRGCVDLAAQLSAPTVGLIPAAIGRVEPLSSLNGEWQRAVDRAREVAQYAAERGIWIGIEAVNRYESFLVNTAQEALAFADEVGVPNVGVILDSYHMNIEEPDGGVAVRTAGTRLRALHLADSNRRGLGHGHLDVAALIATATAAGFAGPLVFEFVAPGPNPFRARGAPADIAALEAYLHDSVSIAQRSLRRPIGESETNREGS